MLTANGKYDYSMEIRGISLLLWVLKLYQNIDCIQNPKTIVVYGSMQFDTLAMIIINIFVDDPLKDIDVYNISDRIHYSQMTNYLYWIENTPWKFNTIYRNPNIEINDYDMYSMYGQSKNLPDSQLNIVMNLAREILNIKKKLRTRSKKNKSKSKNKLKKIDNITSL